MLSIILAIEDEQDRSFVEKLYNEYEKKLYSMALDILHNRSDAEDCVHETVVRLITYLPKYKEISPTYRKNLLFVTCRHVAYDSYNKNVKRAENTISMTSLSEAEKFSEYDVEDYSANLEQLMINQENSEILQKYLMKLNQIDRDIIFLRYYLQLSTKETACIVNLSANAVDLRVSRVRKRLMQMGGEELYGIYRA